MKKTVRKNFFKKWDIKNKDNSATNKLYVLKNIKVDKKALAKIDSVCKTYNISKEGRLFLQHIIGSTKINLKDELKKGWVSINSNNFIRPHFGDITSDINKLEEMGWLLISSYVPGNHSRRYKFPEEKLERLLESDPLTFEQHQQTIFYDLGTGRKINARDWESRQWHDRHDLYRHPYPDIIQESLDVYRTCPVMYKKGEAYLRQQNKLLKKLAYTYCCNRGNTKIEAKYKKKRAQYLVDRCAYQAMLNRGMYIDNTNANIGWYYMTYRTVWTGRFAEAETGLQGCSRRFTRILMSKQNNIYNYDLKSCQPTILLHEFKKAGVACQWLEYYIEGKDENGNVVPDIKKYYAAKIGVDVPTWKVIINGTIFGSNVSDEIWQRYDNIHRKQNQVFNNTQSFLNNSSLKGVYKWSSVCKSIQTTIKPLTDALELWKQQVLKDVRYNSNEVWKYSTKGGAYISGPCETKFFINSYLVPDPNRAKGHYVITKEEKLEKEFLKKYTALILQGQEARFIHTLEQLSTEFEYQPLSNAHDGLISRGEIPEEAINLAKTITNIHYAELVEKSF